jgi:RNA polymerase sigma-70 factor (ECF subfamily)
VPAFEELVRRHHELVLRVAASAVSENECEDVAQDAFLRAFHRLGRLRAGTPFRIWLLGIAHDAALAAATARREDAPAPLAGEPAAAAARTPADLLERRERIERLGIKLKGLSPEHRMVLVLRDVEGLTYEEIAAATGAPLGSVKARLHRARRELAQALRENTYDWEIPRERSGRS